MRGADFGLTYEVPTSYGTFRSTTQVTYLDSYQVFPLPGGTEHQLIGHVVGPFLRRRLSEMERPLAARMDPGTGSTPRSRRITSTAFTSWAPTVNPHWVGQTWLFDLQASYEFWSNSRSHKQAGPERFHNGWGTWRNLLNGVKLTVGCNNLFDHDPPQSNDNFPRFIYDTSGRFIYFSLTKKF